MKLFLGLAILSLTITADARAAQLTGVVLLEDAPVPGVALSVLEQGRVVREVVTDSGGGYAIELQSGTHTLTAQLAGLKTIRRELCLGDDTRYDVRMSLDLPVDSVTVRTCGDRSEPTMRRVHGRVVSHVLAPVAGAVVRIESSPVYDSRQGDEDRVQTHAARSVSVQTNVSGDFSLELSAIGDASLTVTVPGYQTETFTLGAPSASPHQIVLLPSCM